MSTKKAKKNDLIENFKAQAAKGKQKDTANHDDVDKQELRERLVKKLEEALRENGGFKK